MYPLYIYGTQNSARKCLESAELQMLWGILLRDSVDTSLMSA